MKISSNNQSGYIVLVTVLIVGVSATTVGLFLLLTGTNAAITSGGVAANAQTKAASLGCAQLALAEIKENPVLVTPASDNFTLDENTDQQCNYTINGSAPNYTILSTGTVRQTSDNYVHRLTITTDQVTPQVTVSSWQDTP